MKPLSLAVMADETDTRDHSEAAGNRRSGRGERTLCSLRTRKR